MKGLAGGFVLGQFPKFVLKQVAIRRIDPFQPVAGRQRQDLPVFAAGSDRLYREECLVVGDVLFSDLVQNRQQ